MAGSPLSLDRLSVEQLVALGDAVDGVVFEVLKVSTVPATLSIERRLAKLLGAGWKKVATGALRASLASFAKKPLTSSSINTFLRGLGAKMKSPLTQSQIATLQGHVKKIWTIAKGVRANELKIPLRFDLVDKRAVDAISRHQVFWTRDFYSRHLSDRVRGVTEEVMLRQGLPREEAGKVLHAALKREMGLTPGGRSNFAKTIPAKFAGDPDRYFGDIAANASHQARTFGALQAFEEAEVVRYTLDNPMDERTGQICRELNGQTFTVSAAQAKVAQIVDAKKPTDVKNVAPWLTGTEIVDTIDGARKGSARASRNLQQAGIMLPPFHPRCRTEVVVV